MFTNSKRIALWSVLTISLGLSPAAPAAIFSVTNTNPAAAGSLSQALALAQSDTNATININPGLGPILLNGPLPPIENNLVINGNSNTINGAGAWRIFFVNAPNKTVQINALMLADGLAQGGSGGLGHGGGGGGGMDFPGGTGGTAAATYAPGGGGGALTSAGAAGDPNATRAGTGGGINGALGGLVETLGSVSNGLSATLPDGGGGGGGLSIQGDGGNGGSGNDFSGGGGAGSSENATSGPGGNGGFGGGGGGGANAFMDAYGGGNGGFGGGGGGGSGGEANSVGSSGGFGGGNGATGNTGNAGGGLGAGGAIFARTGATLTLQDCAFSGNIVIFGLAGGTAATAGAAIGQAVFLGANVNYSVSAGTNTLVDTIGGGNDLNANGWLFKSGAGKLVLLSPESYFGSTIVSNGTLEVVNNVLPSTAVTINSNAVLDYNYSSRILGSGITYTGTGTLRADGTGSVVFGPGVTYVDFSPGALIDVESGLLTGSSSYGGNWGNNYASLNIASNAVFDAVEAGLTGTMQIDALTGAGIFQGGYFGNANSGLTTITIGIAGGSGTFSGKLQNDASARLGVAKVGAGTEIFSGTNNLYTGGTLVGSGTLVINGNAGLGNVTVTNGTLAGVGSVAGSVIVGTNGTFAPGFPTGTFSVTNTLSLAGNTLITLNSGANSQVTGLASVTYGGTLTITNLGGPLVVGNTFTLFSAAAWSGNFAAITGNAGNSLGFNFNPTNGVLTVVPTLPTTPTNISYTMQAGLITVKWPANYTGWILQAQTNTLARGIGTNWTDVPGSAAVASMNFPMNHTNSVFFRLRLP
jgi:hypothetical protein